MKKKLLSIILLVTALILVGCGAEESEGEVASIYMTDGPKYQYQMINTDEIMVQYEDGRPDKKLSDYSGSYTTDTAVYLGSEVGVYLDGEHYSTVVEYVPYTNIDFKRNVGDIDLYILMCREMEAKTDWFEGTITYADGYVGSIDAKEVELKRNADKLVVKITVWGNDALGYEILIPEAWDDMNLNEQSQEEIDEWYDGLVSGDSEVTEESMSSSVVKDGDFLSTLGVSKAEFISHLESIGYFTNEDYMRIDQRICEFDPRNDEDWSTFIRELESKVDSYDMSTLDVSDPAVWVVQLLYLACYDGNNNVLMLQNGYDPTAEPEYVYDEVMRMEIPVDIGADLRSNFPLIEAKKVDVKPNSELSEDDVKEKCDWYNNENHCVLTVSSYITQYKNMLKKGYSEQVNNEMEFIEFLNIYDYVFNGKEYIDYETHISEYGYIFNTKEDLEIADKYGYI